MGAAAIRTSLPALLDENPSYVFFREVPAPLPGSLEAEIDGPYRVARRAAPARVARSPSTRASIPLGAPVFLATTYPLSTQPLQRLMLAQDTGGAIRGAVRADFFWGFGDDAGPRGGPDEAGRPDVAAVAEGSAPTAASR